MAIKNAGTATMRFKEGIFVEGQSVHGDANQLVVSGSISVMGTENTTSYSAAPTNGTYDRNEWYYIPGNTQDPTNSSYEPRTPSSPVPVDDGSTTSGAFYTFWGGSIHISNVERMISLKTAVSGTVTISFKIIAGGNNDGSGSNNQSITQTIPLANSTTTPSNFAHANRTWTSGSSNTDKPVQIAYATTGYEQSDDWTPVSSGTSSNFRGHYNLHPNAADQNINVQECTSVSYTITGISGNFYVGIIQDDNGSSYNSWAITDLVVEEGESSGYVNFEGSSFAQGADGIGFRNNAGYMEYKDEGGSWKQFNSLAVGPTAPDRSVQFNNNGDLGSGNFFYGSNANVGIGDFSNADSDYLLHVKGNSGYTGNEGKLVVSDRGDDPAQIILAREAGTGGLIQSVSDGDSLGIFGFHGRNSSGTWIEGARMEGIASVDSGNVGADIKFQVKTPSGTLEDKMIIGNDGIITFPDGRNIIDSTNDNGGLTLNQKLQFRVNGTEVGAVSVDGIQSDVLYSKGVIGHVGVVGQNGGGLLTSDQRVECFHYSSSDFRPHTDFITDNLSTQTLGTSSAVWNTAFANTVQNVTGSSMFVKSDESLTLQINQTGDQLRWGTNGGDGSPVEFKIQANYASSYDSNTNEILGTSPRNIISFQTTGTTGANGTISIGEENLYLDSGINFYGDTITRKFSKLGSGTNNTGFVTNYMGQAYYTADRFWDESWYIARVDANGDSQNELAWKEILETQTTTNNEGNPQVTKRFGTAHSGDFQESFRIGSGGAFILGENGTTTGFSDDLYGRAHLGFVPYDTSVAGATGSPLMTISVYDDESVPGRNITNTALNAYNAGYSDEYQETFRMMVKAQTGYDATDDLNVGNSFHIQLMQDGQSGLQESFTITSLGKIGLGDSSPSASHKVSVGGDLFVDGSVDCQQLRFNVWQNESTSTPTGTLIKFDDTSNDLILNASNDFDTVIMGGTTSNEIFKVDNESENVYMRGTVYIGNHTDVDVSGSLGTNQNTDQGCVPSPGGLYAPSHLQHKSASGWPYDATDYTNGLGPVLYVENTHTVADKPIATFVNTHRDDDADGIHIIIGKEINTHSSYPSGWEDDGTNPNPTISNSFLSFFSPTINVDVDDNLLDTIGSNTFWGGTVRVGRISGDGAEGIRIFGDTFTGTHDVSANSEATIGMIMESTGEMWIKTNVSTALPQVQLASVAKSPKVFGVAAANQIESGRACRIKDDKYPLTVNSLGEGCVWVTNLVGEPTNGDYITSSPIGGYGQLQDDDILHSYTVAKLTETIDWSSVTDTIDHDGSTYKRYLAGCTYHCG